MLIAFHWYLVENAQHTPSDRQSLDVYFLCVVGVSTAIALREMTSSKQMSGLLWLY